MSIDLSDLDIVALAETGTVTELRHPGTKKPLVDDAGKPYFIEHRGFDSASVRDLATRFQNRRIEAIRKNKDAGDVSTMETETVAKLCAGTIRWYLPPLKGVPVGEYTNDLGKQIYSNPGLVWIVEQYLEDANDRSRLFTTGSNS